MIASIFNLRAPHTPNFRRADLLDREILMQGDPLAFFITDAIILADRPWAGSREYHELQI
jgi:hypothetical protein